MNKKVKYFLITLLVLICAFIGGTMVYQKGQEDNQRRVWQEQDRQRRDEQRQQRVNALKKAIPHKQAEIQMAYNELSSINQFQFLRTPSEKEEQLAAQNKILNDLKQQLSEMDRELQNLESQNYKY